MTQPAPRPTGPQQTPGPGTHVPPAQRPCATVSPVSPCVHARALRQAMSSSALPWHVLGRRRTTVTRAAAGRPTPRFMRPALCLALNECGQPGITVPLASANLTRVPVDGQSGEPPLGPVWYGDHARFTRHRRGRAASATPPREPLGEPAGGGTRRPARPDQLGRRKRRTAVRRVPRADDARGTSYAAHFDTPAGYLDFARFGPPSRDAVAASARALEESATADHTTVDVLMRAEEAARDTAARLTGTDARHTVLPPGPQPRTGRGPAGSASGAPARGPVRPRPAPAPPGEATDSAPCPRRPVTRAAVATRQHTRTGARQPR